MTTELFQRGVRFQDGSVQLTAAAAPNRNLILNGNFAVDQRNLGVLSAANSAATVQYIGPDRWCSYGTLAGKFKLQQTVNTTPYRFLQYSHYLTMFSQTTFTMGSPENYRISQRIPIEYTRTLQWGVNDGSGANAGSSITLSFWTFSNNTGLHSGSITNTFDNVNIFPLSYPFSYTIDTVNTWEKKTIVIPPPPAGVGGVVGWQEPIGMTLNFCMGATGSFVAATAGTWTYAEKYFVSRPSGLPPIASSSQVVYWTGIQIEKGTVATETEVVEYGSELSECQRYFRRVAANTRAYSFDTGTNPTTVISYSTMRAIPTATIIAGSRANATVTVAVLTDSAAGHRCGSTAGTATTYAEGDVILLSAEL